MNWYISIWAPHNHYDNMYFSNKKMEFTQNSVRETHRILNHVLITEMNGVITLLFFLKKIKHNWDRIKIHYQPASLCCIYRAHPANISIFQWFFLLFFFLRLPLTLRNKMYIKKEIKNIIMVSVNTFIHDVHCQICISKGERYFAICMWPDHSILI